MTHPTKEQALAALYDLGLRIKELRAIIPDVGIEMCGQSARLQNIEAWYSGDGQTIRTYIEGEKDSLGAGEARTGGVALVDDLIQVEHNLILNHLPPSHFRSCAPASARVPGKVREKLEQIANMRIEVYRLDTDAMKALAKEALAILDQQDAPEKLSFDDVYAAEFSLGEPISHADHCPQKDPNMLAISACSCASPLSPLTDLRAKVEGMRNDNTHDLSYYHGHNAAIDAVIALIDKDTV